MGLYSNEVIEQAERIQNVYGVPASVTLATYAYESGYGTSTLAKNNNNFFGMTGTGTAGSTSGSHQWAKYNNMSDSFDAFGKLLSGKKYSSLTAGANSVDDYVKSYAETYAPSSDGNSNYAGNVLNIINRDNLTQYDNGNYTTGVDSENVIFGIGDGEKWYITLGRYLLVFIMIILLLAVAVIGFMKAFDLK